MRQPSLTPVSNSMHVLTWNLSYHNRSTDWSPPQRPSAACNALSPPACCRRRSHRRRPSARPLCCRWFSLTVTRALRPVGPRGPLVGSWARARWPGYDRAVAHSHSWCRRHVWHDRCGRRCTSRCIRAFSPSEAIYETVSVNSDPVYCEFNTVGPQWDLNCVL